VKQESFKKLSSAILDDDNDDVSEILNAVIALNLLLKI
jgi:hypothetical protein